MTTMFTAHAAVQLRQRHRDKRIGTGTECTLLTEFADSRDRLRIEKQVHSSFPVCQIDKIRQINHRQMYGMYLLRKEEMILEHESTGTVVKELVLYHVTTEKRGVESLQSGLDWRRTWRFRFGRGVSFSDDVDYADYYADHSSGEDSRVILVCSVLVAKTYRVKIKRNNRAGHDLDVPPGSADTTVSPNGRVYVKFNDMEFYPLYMVYYRRRKEDLCKSRYFREHKSATAAKNEIKRYTPMEPEVQQHQHELLRSQHEERQRQYEEQQQMLYQQQQQQQQQQRMHQQQQQMHQQQYRQYDNGSRQFRQENNNGCLIL